MEIVFNQPKYLWFLWSVLLLIVIHFYTLKGQRKKALKFANFEAISRITGEEILSKNLFLLAIRVLSLVFIIFALSGIVVWYMGESTNANYVLAIDASSSMEANDISPTRLEAAKDVAKQFVDKLKGNPKIGVISFSGVSTVNQDLTDDMFEVKSAISQVEVKETGGTDLGEAIINGANLLSKDDKARSLILLTDGQSNVGIPLEDALTYAIEYKVVINTIGIGTSEGAAFTGEALSQLDERSLRIISESTGGTFNLVTNKRELEEAYESIIMYTKQKLSLNLSPYLMVLAIMLLFFEWALINTKYRILP